MLNYIYHIVNMKRKKKEKRGLVMAVIFLKANEKRDQERQVQKWSQSPMIEIRQQTKIWKMNFTVLKQIISSTSNHSSPLKPSLILSPDLSFFPFNLH